MDAISAQLSRIEFKLDMLIQALSEDEQEQEPGAALDGSPIPAERDQNQPL
jgi:hypothetical protein